MLEIFITPQFQKDFKKIPTSFISRIDSIVSILKQNPFNKSLNVKKLKGFKQNIWRVKIDSYRLIYSFNKTFIILHRIRHRKDIYKNL